MEKKNPQGIEYYRFLTRKMILLAFAVSFTPLILISGIILYQFHVSYHEKVMAHLDEVVLKHRQQIDSFLDEKLTDILVMAKTFRLEQLLDESFLQDKLAILQEEHRGAFVDLGLVNEEGTQVAYAGAFKLGRVRYSEADWFKEASKRQHFISDVFLGVRGLPHFIVAVEKKWQGKTWILRSTIDFVAFNALVENLRIGKTGLAFIINRKGEFQTKQPVPITLESTAYLDLFSKGTFSEDGGVSPVTVLRKDQILGRYYINVMTPLKNGEWLLIYRQDAADAFQDLYRTRRLAVIIFVLGGLGIVIMAVVLSKRITSHIAAADQEKELMTEQVVEAGKLASIGELAAGIAHEINNPVAIMVEEAGWIGDIIEDDDICDELDEVQRALNQIKSQGERCKQITHKLLSFARKTDPELRRVQINEVIEEVVAFVEQRARYSNVRVKMDLAPALPEVYASASEFEQVLLNLMNNALDAMSPDGGTLTVATGAEGKHVIVDVTDTGQGIPQANLSRIFDPFFTTKPQGQGTGLGLSICYGITKKMGGDISVDSTVGKGSTLCVRIPLPPADETRRKLPHKRSEEHPGKD